MQSTTGSPRSEADAPMEQVTEILRERFGFGAFKPGDVAWMHNLIKYTHERR